MPITHVFSIFSVILRMHASLVPEYDTLLVKPVII